MTVQERIRMRIRFIVMWAVLIAATGIVFQFSTATPTFANSSRFCKNYAHDYASRSARRNVARGTVIGAGAGGLIGGIANGGRGAGTGAAIGAGVGLIGSASARRNDYNFYYRRAYSRCRRW
jgi:uncharacterized protein YcfJ